jgi:hypothetical protein
LRIYYEREKNTTRGATDNGRAGIGRPNNADMNIIAEGKGFIDDDSNTFSDHVIIMSSYLPRSILTAAWSMADEIIIQRYTRNEHRHTRTGKERATISAASEEETTTRVD